MTDNNLGKTFYNDLSAKEVYKNFLIKYPAFGYIRWFLLGFFGLIFKMVVRINRAMRDPVTGEINWKYTAYLWSAIAFVLALIGIGIWMALTVPGATE